MAPVSAARATSRGATSSSAELAGSSQIWSTVATCKYWHTVHINNIHILHTQGDTYIHVDIHTYICTHTCIHECKHACMHSYVRTYVRTIVGALIHTCIHTYTYMLALHYVTLHYPTLHYINYKLLACLRAYLLTHFLNLT